MSMPFRDSCNYVLTWGKYSGQKVDAACSKDEGLRYLDWSLTCADSMPPRDVEAILVYILHPSIESRLSAIRCDDRL